MDIARKIREGDMCGSTVITADDIDDILALVGAAVLARAALANVPTNELTPEVTAYLDEGGDGHAAYVALDEAIRLYGKGK